MDADIFWSSGEIQSAHTCRHQLQTENLLIVMVCLSAQAIVISFLLIIGLMLATTWVTVKLGGVHFNE